MAIDHIFGTTVLSLLEARLTNHPLQDVELQDLLALAIERCQNYSKPPQVPIDNKRTIFNLFSMILGVLSKNYFTIVTDNIWDNVPTMISHKSKTQVQALTRVEALKHIHLDVSDQMGVDNTLSFLTKFSAVLKNSKISKEARLVLSQSTVSMLRRVAIQPLAEDVDYMELHRLLAGLYDAFSTAKRKQREHVQTWYPLLSALLSAADSKFFLAHWLDLCQSMAPLLQKKTLRPLLVQSIKLLVETYCSKFSLDDPNHTASLDSLCSCIFFTSSKTSTKTTNTAFQGEPVSNLEIFIDIVISIAKCVYLLLFYLYIYIFLLIFIFIYLDVI